MIMDRICAAENDTSPQNVCLAPRAAEVGPILEAGISILGVVDNIVNESSH